MSSDVKHYPKIGELRSVDPAKWLWVYTNIKGLDYTTIVKNRGELRLQPGEVMIVLSDLIPRPDNEPADPRVRLLTRIGICYASYPVMMVHTEAL